MNEQGSVKDRRAYWDGQAIDYEGDVESDDVESHDVENDDVESHDVE